MSYLRSAGRAADGWASAGRAPSRARVVAARQAVGRTKFSGFKRQLRSVETDSAAVQRGAAGWDEVGGVKVSANQRRTMRFSTASVSPGRSRPLSVCM